MSFIYFYLLILLHPYIALWPKSFTKAGRKSWEALIPGYNYYVAFKITIDKPFWSLLLLFPGVHLVMLASINVSYIRRFGFFSFTDTLQGIFFPYLIFAKIANSELPFLNETNWSNSREIQMRKWGDHIVLFLSVPILGHIIALAFGMFSREKPGVKSRIKEWGDSILFALVAASIIRTYVFEPFQIPTGSMEKTLLVGDFLFVNKLAYGSKVPVTPLSYPLVHNTIPWINIKSYTTLEKGTYTRLPGFGKVNRNDVVVFNYPSGDTAVFDPRMPDGLMGHDYHGIINNEAFYQFRNSPEIGNKFQNLLAELKKRGETEQRADSIANSELLKYYIESNSKWKQLARQKLARGEFPGDPDMTGTLPEKHGGLVFRPVDKRENYIKRCVGIPGDKMKVEASVLYVNEKKAFVSENQCLQYKVPKKSVLFPTATEMYERYKLENDPNGSRTDFNEENPEFYLLTLTKSEKRLIEKDFKIKMEIYRTPRYSESPEYIPNAMELIENASVFPKDFFINNTTTDFQEFQVPAKGQTIKISKGNIAWYRRIITAYEGHKLEERKDGSILIDGKKVTAYTFSMNYYWLMGDNRYQSADSRVWGFVPEDHVVGRASMVWFSKSVDPEIGIRWERLFKLIR
jgi:signal peptidase I